MSSQVGLKQHALGGVFLYAPSALCGSPVLTQGRSGLPVLPYECSGVILLAHTPITQVDDFRSTG